MEFGWAIQLPLFTKRKYFIFIYVTECRRYVSRGFKLRDTYLDIQRRSESILRARRIKSAAAICSASSLNDDTKGLYVEWPDASGRILELSHA